MEKHYELKEEKVRFLFELWYREHGMKLDWLIGFPSEEAARYIEKYMN